MVTFPYTCDITSSNVLDLYIQASVICKKYFLKDAGVSIKFEVGSQFE